MLKKVNGKFLLINYGGYQFTTNTFIPDNSLGLLAATIESLGIDVEVMDLHNRLQMGEISKNFNHEAGREIISSLFQQQDLEIFNLNKFQNSVDYAESTFINNLIKQISQKVKEENIVYIGFKLWLGRGLKLSISMAMQLKKIHPMVKFFAGGPALQYLQHYFHEYCSIFDHLIFGEGEIALTKLLSNIKDQASTNRPPLLDDILPPKYDSPIFSHLEHFHKIRIIDDSRGCFNHCAFCSHSNLIGKGVRSRSPKKVVDQIEWLHQTQEINFFRFSGSNTPWKLVKGVGEEILQRNLKINYSIFSSFNNIRQEDLNKLAESGLKSIFLGLESGDEDILKNIFNKHHPEHEKIINISKHAMSLGIFICLSVIYPAPFETEISKSNTIKLLQTIFSESSNLTHGSVLIMPPFLSPGSLWWDKMQDYGLSLDSGISKKEYLINLANNNYDYLFINSTIHLLGQMVNGKNMQTIVKESADFCREISQLGIPINISDTTYLMSLLYQKSVSNFTVDATKELILGGQ